jgi:PAS domain S-box-containing protein
MTTKSDHIIEGQKALAEVLFNSIGDGAVTTDEYGRITRINPIAQNILGYSEAEVIGKWLPKLLASYNNEGLPIPLIERPVTRAFVTGNIISERIHYKHKSGKLIPIAMTISPIMVKNQPLGCIEIFRDITSEFEIDKMKSDFISLASHQLRTPLSAIKTYTHMLLDGFMGPLTKPQIKSLKTVISASNRMNETISTLLNITRIESGSIAIAKKQIAIDLLLEEIISEHHLAATDKNIEIIFTHPAEKTKLISDVVILKEIFGNLLSNAIKYTANNGKITVTIKSKGNQIIVTIKDNGLGIPLESQTNIFTKFFRADNVIKQETSGTGLGLYLVKGLVEELDGKVWFESKEKEGTTFFVSFPIFAHTIKTSIVKK